VQATDNSRHVSELMTASGGKADAPEEATSWQISRRARGLSYKYRHAVDLHVQEQN